MSKMNVKLRKGFRMGRTENASKQVLNYETFLNKQNKERTRFHILKGQALTISS